jgi:hypothetical protein
MSSHDPHAHDAAKPVRLILLPDGVDVTAHEMVTACGTGRAPTLRPETRTAINALLAASRTLRATSERQRQRAARARWNAMALLKRNRPLPAPVPQQEA